MEKLKISHGKMTKKNVSLGKYKNTVIDDLKNEFKEANKEFLKRLYDYIQTEEFEKDIQHDYNNGVCVNSCVYNIYMYV